MRRIVLPLFALFVAGCYSLSGARVTDPNPIRLTADEEQAKKAIIARITPGMDIEDAKKVMEVNGFECHYGREGEGYISAERGEFRLVCSRFLTRSFVASEEILAYVLIERGKVAEVRVTLVRSCM